LAHSGKFFMTFCNKLIALDTFFIQIYHIFDQGRGENGEFYPGPR
jgi:hypothetical protein